MNSQSNEVTRRRLAFAAMVGMVVAAGCEVQNPGPVGDEYVALPASQQGLLNGSWERMNNIIGNYAYNTSRFTGELTIGSGVGNTWFDILNWGLAS